VVLLEFLEVCDLVLSSFVGKLFQLANIEVLGVFSIKPL